MFEAKMNDIYNRFVERTDSQEGDAFMVVAGRMLCLSACNIVTAFLQIFITLGEIVVYGLSSLAEYLSNGKNN